MKRRIASIVLAGSLSAALLAGCGNGGAGSENSSGKTVITFMNHTGEEATINYEDEMIAAFEEANEDIEVEVQRMSMDDYTQTIQTKIASGDAPDVFYIEQSVLDKYAGSGYLMDLTDTEIADHYDGNMLQYDGKMYGAPLNVSTYVVTYNKNIFEDLNLEIPETLDEFYTICDQLKAAGITPLAAGYQDSWVLQADSQAEYANSILVKDQDALKKLQSREVQFTGNADWEGVFNRFAKRVAYEQEDQFGTDWNTACTMFATGEAAMIVSGDWTSNNIADMGEEVEMGVFVLPVSNTASENVIAVPGAGQSYAIYADTEKQEAAEKFVSFMTSADAGNKYVEAGLGVCVIKGVEVSQSDSALGDIITYMNEGKAELMDWDYDANFSSEYQAAFNNCVSDFVLNGCKDVDGLLADLDAEFDRIAGE